MADHVHEEDEEQLKLPAAPQAHRVEEQRLGEEHPPLSSPDHSTAAVTQRQVRFRPEPHEVVEYDGHLTSVERDLLFYDADELRQRARSETQKARKIWRNQRGYHQPHPQQHVEFCVRGLEKRLRSSQQAQRKKWHTFLESFLALQQDLRKLDDDVSNLIMVFVSTHSKADRIAAQQVAQQDEAIAFGIYNDDDGEGASHATASASGLRRGSSRKLNLSSHGGGETQSQPPQQQQRSSVSCRRARSA